MEIHPVKTLRLRTRVLQNTAALLGGRGISIVLSAGASVLLTRYLGSERLGQFGAIYAYLGLFTWLTTLGLEPVLVREISKERESASNLLHTAIILASFLSVGALLASILFSPWAGFNGHLRTLLILAALEFVLIPFRLPGIIFQVDLRQWYAATINVVRQGLWFGIVIILWLLGASLFYVVLGRLLATAVESALTWAYSRQFLSAGKKFLRERSGKILRHSIPIAFTGLLSMVYLRIDQVMLHKMASDFVLGQYVAAVRVSELFEFLPGSSLVRECQRSAQIPGLHRQTLPLFHDCGFRYLCIHERRCRIGCPSALRQTILACGSAAGSADLVGDSCLFCYSRV
jgi:O-antigen/teichoic acid export membrane protein